MVAQDGNSGTQLRTVRIYDTSKAEVVPLKPLNPPRVYMFACGITPYKPSHIGHARAAVIYDVVARLLRHLGYHVFYMTNITDIEDKIIKAATEEGVDWRIVAERNFSLYIKAMEKMGVISPNLYPRSTDFVPEIIEQIKTIIKNGHAYESEGDVYFDVASFPSFGSLSGQRIEKLEVGSRSEENTKKRAPEDFTLWKQERIGPRWESPWSMGRPGWHIEDTAMTVTLFGPRYDIHGGGLELKFPHHEAEIAQAESATGQHPLASIWMHNNMLNMHGEKMSKSLGNVLSIDDAFKIVSPQVLRFYVLSAHYRSVLDYLGPDSMTEAKRSYETLQSAYAKLNAFSNDRFKGKFPKEWKAPNGNAHYVLTWKEWIDLAYDTLPRDLEKNAGDKVEETMLSALCEDFQVREATSSLFTWGPEMGKALAERGLSMSDDDLLSLWRPYILAQRVLGYFLEEGPAASADVAPLVDVALKARARARARGDYAESDKIRQELASAGIVVEDSAAGPKWKVKQ
jgi:cysteinyl-tRNA synthetase